MYGFLILRKDFSGTRIRLREERVCGLRILRAEVPVRNPRRETHRLRRGGMLLCRRGVRELLNPPDFSGWPVLEKTGLQTVDTGELCRAAAAALALEVLRLRGWEPGRAVVMLAGERVGKYLLRAAEELAGQVARVIIDVPGEGAELAARLHREYGLPILPPGTVRPALTLAFDESWRGRGAALLLYGPLPKLLGAQVYAQGLELPEDYPPMPFLAVLRKNGLVSDRTLRSCAQSGREREITLDNSLQNTYNSLDNKNGLVSE